MEEERLVSSSHLPAAKLWLPVASDWVQNNTVLVSLDYRQVDDLNNFLFGRKWAVYGKDRQSAPAVTHLSYVGDVGLCVVDGNQPLITNVTGMGGRRQQ